MGGINHQKLMVYGTAIPTLCATLAWLIIPLTDPTDGILAEKIRCMGVSVLFVERAICAACLRLIILESCCKPPGIVSLWIAIQSQKASKHSHSACDWSTPVVGFIIVAIRILAHAHIASLLDMIPTVFCLRILEEVFVCARSRAT